PVRALNIVSLVGDGLVQSRPFPLAYFANFIIIFVWGGILFLPAVIYLILSVIDMAVKTDRITSNIAQKWIHTDGTVSNIIPVNLPIRSENASFDIVAIIGINNVFKIVTVMPHPNAKLLEMSFPKKPIPASIKNTPGG
ncbi:unnamed protein product, partial [marine sediment metagenome]